MRCPNLTRALILLTGLAAVAAAITYVLPPTFDVERRIVIAAEPARVHEVLGDLSTWPEWSAWSRAADPSAEMEIEGPRGPGQRWTWHGDRLGKGELVLLSSDPREGIEYELEGGAIRGRGTVRLLPTEEGTEVVWRGHGELPYVLRWLGLKLDGDLGAEIDESLRSLKARLESASPAAAGPPAEAPEPAAEPAG